MEYSGLSYRSQVKPSCSVLWICFCQIKRCLNANSESPSESRLTTVQFHPSAQIVMTAGLDHSVSLFQVTCESPDHDGVKWPSPHKITLTFVLLIRLTAKPTQRSRPSIWRSSRWIKLRSALTGNTLWRLDWGTNSSTSTIWWRARLSPWPASEVSFRSGCDSFILAEYIITLKCVDLGDDCNLVFRSEWAEGLKLPGFSRWKASAPLWILRISPSHDHKGAAAAQTSFSDSLINVFSS